MLTFSFQPRRLAPTPLQETTYVNAVLAGLVMAPFATLTPPVEIAMKMQSVSKQAWMM